MAHCSHGPAGDPSPRPCGQVGAWLGSEPVRKPRWAPHGPRFLLFVHLPLLCLARSASFRLLPPPLPPSPFETLVTSVQMEDGLGVH